MPEFWKLVLITSKVVQSWWTTVKSNNLIWTWPSLILPTWGSIKLYYHNKEKKETAYGNNIYTLSCQHRSVWYIVRTLSREILHRDCSTRPSPQNLVVNRPGRCRYYFYNRNHAIFIFTVKTRLIMHQKLKRWLGALNKIKRQCRAYLH